MAKIEEMMAELRATPKDAKPRDGNITYDGVLHAALKEFCRERELKLRRVIEWLVIDLLREDQDGLPDD